MGGAGWYRRSGPGRGQAWRKEQPEPGTQWAFDLVVRTQGVRSGQDWGEWGLRSSSHWTCVTR